MTTQARTCANCASLNPTPAADEPLCWNLVSIDQADVAAGGVCPEHQTTEEDAADTATCEAYRRLGCDWMVSDYLASAAVARSAICRAQQRL